MSTLKQAPSMVLTVLLTVALFCVAMSALGLGTIDRLDLVLGIVALAGIAVLIGWQAIARRSQ